MDDKLNDKEIESLDQLDEDIDKQTPMDASTDPSIEPQAVEPQTVTETTVAEKSDASEPVEVPETLETPKISPAYIETNREIPKKPKRKKRLVRFVATMVILALVAGSFFGAGYVSSVYLNDSILAKVFGTVETSNTSATINQIKPVINLEEGGYTEAPIMISREMGPAVVTINTSYDNPNSSYLFDYYSEGSGSGVIFDMTDEELLLVTNYHVIAGTDALEVVVHSGESYTPTVLGFDSQLDLAVLAIPLKDIDQSVLDQLVLVSFGDSSSLQVGEMAIALGSPLGEDFSNTITVGIISAMNRTINLEGVNHTLIQTDAAINPGNSGGALFNQVGELIGINSAKYIDTNVEGMGFAIPINIALPIIHEIVDSRPGEDIAVGLSTDRPFLGVQIQDISGQLAEEIGIPFGVYITEVFPGSGADEAGLLSGDVIIAIDDERILNTAELTSIILSHEVDDSIDITAIRGEKVMEFTAPLYHYDDVIQE
jgi:serine protease Do